MLHHYDYYEFEELYAVSEDFDKLVKYKEGLDVLWGDEPILTYPKDQADYASKEKAHWRIEEVKYLK